MNIYIETINRIILLINIWTQNLLQNTYILQCLVLNPRQVLYLPTISVQFLNITSCAKSQGSLAYICHVFNITALSIFYFSLGMSSTSLVVLSTQLFFPWSQCLSNIFIHPELLYLITRLVIFSRHVRIYVKQCNMVKLHISLANKRGAEYI